MWVAYSMKMYYHLCMYMGIICVCIGVTYSGEMGHTFGENICTWKLRYRVGRRYGGLLGNDVCVYKSRSFFFQLRSGCDCNYDHIMKTYGRRVWPQLRLHYENIWAQCSTTITIIHWQFIYSWCDHNYDHTLKTCKPRVWSQPWKCIYVQSVTAITITQWKHIDPECDHKLRSHFENLWVQDTTITITPWKYMNPGCDRYNMNPNEGINISCWIW